MAGVPVESCQAERTASPMDCAGCPGSQGSSRKKRMASAYHAAADSYPPIRSPTARAEAGAASLMRAMSVRAAAVSVVLSVKRR